MAGASARRLMRKVLARLSGEKLTTFLLFLKEVSVGDFLAIELLKAAGVRNPQQVIKELIDEGWLERGLGCVSLSKEIRRALASDGVDVLTAGRELAERIERLKRPIMAKQKFV
ncbi:MAG: hypothetical protein J7J20_04680 [Desulfurococcales archaeon]|nr:hypothetical protein [Desulfurococcales archaeon]